MHKLIILLLLVFLSQYSFAGRKDTLSARNIEFIENKGQWQANILYKAHINGGAIYLERDRFTIDLVDLSELKHSHAHDDYDLSEKKEEVVHRHAYQMIFNEGNTFLKIIPKEECSDYNNYFIGNDKNKWQAKVKKYKSILYKEVYRNIDMLVTGDGGYFKYEFVIKPKAKIEDISIKYIGADKLSLSEGNLIVNTSIQKIIELKPYIYQFNDSIETSVQGYFRLHKNELKFNIPKYDKSQTLIIDPSLVFSTYTGSSADNWGFTATFDIENNVYSGGIVDGIGYPINPGAYHTTFEGIWDVGIIKYNDLGTQKLYATYLGGESSEMPHSLIVNEFNELLIFGTTGSTTFPTTPNAYDITFNGGQTVYYDNTVVFLDGVDIFVARLSPDGSQLRASTYIGGSENDGLNFRPYYGNVMMHGNDSLYYNYADGARGEIITDDRNNVYVGSCTFSTDFPITSNAFQQTSGGKQEGVAFKLDYNLSNLIWSSYIGGIGDDAVYSVDVDQNYDLYVAGGTNSNNFPVTSGSLHTSYLGGTADGFVSHISQNGTNLMHSSYFGSSAYDQSYFVRTDRRNNVYLFGQTKASGSTLIFNSIYSRPNSGQFLTKLNPSLNQLIWSTVFGTGNGKPNISPTAFAVDICNRIYISGWGREWANHDNYTWANTEGTKNMDITPGAFQSVTDGQDFYIMVIKDDASAMDYATYFGEVYYPSCSYSGHDHVDGGTSRFDKRGNIYQSVCASCGSCQQFPTSPNPGAWSNINSSYNCNNAVFKFNIFNDFALAEFSMPNIGCAPHTVDFNNTSDGNNFIWNFGDGSPLSQIRNPSHTYYNSGVFNVTLIAINPNSCNGSDTITKQIQILSDTSYRLPDAVMCFGDIRQIGITPNPDPTITYLWSPSNSLNDATVANPFANPSITTDYILMVSNGICTDTIRQRVRITSLFVDAGNDTLTCFGNIILHAHSSEPSAQYIWSSNVNFTDTLNAPLTNNSVNINITQPTTFYVKAFISNCQGIDSIKVSFVNFVDSAIIQDPICFGDCNGLIQLLTSGGISPYRYLWNTGSIQSYISNLCAGDYSVTITDYTNCISTNNFTITQPDSFYLSTISTDIPCIEVCNGTITTNSIGGTIPYTYNWNNGSTEAVLDSLCPGIYSVTVTDSNHCLIHIEDTVRLSPIMGNIHIWADADNSYNRIKDTIYNGLSTTLHTTYVQGATYRWTPVGSLSSSTSYNTTASPTETTTYYLLVTDQYGCTATDSIVIYVIDVFCYEPYIFVPNAFTPDNNGKNDILFVYSTYIQDLTFSIYDRWGEKIFETTDLKKGWDGTYKGSKCNPGVFVYYLDAQCWNLQYFRKKGNVTLIR